MAKDKDKKYKGKREGRTGGADALQAQLDLLAVEKPDLADRQEGPYISEQMKLYNAWLKKQKDKALGGGDGGSKALTEAQKLANKLAVLKIQAEKDKADREAQEVLDDRAASAQEKADAVAERQRKFAAYNKVADIYAGQGAQTDALYGGQLENLPKRQQGDLDVLLKAVSAGQGQITGAENQFLSSLVTPTAYSDVPLVDLSTTQPVNPLMGALGAEGADTAGVTGQSAMDAALAAQFAQLSRNTAGQLNVGSQNYMNALRNAGVGAAAAGRQELATGQTAYQNQINAKYSDLANQLAMQRLQAQQEADVRAAQARAEAAAYGEAPAAAQPPAGGQPPVITQPPVTEQPPVPPVLPPAAPVLPPQYVAGPPPEQGNGRGATYVTPAPLPAPVDVATEEERRRRALAELAAARRAGF